MQIINNPKHGDVIDARSSAHPSDLRIYEGHNMIEEQNATSYGYVLSGTAEVSAPSFTFQGTAGTFFSIPGEFDFVAKGQVVIARRFGFRGLITAGKIELTGRLNYIDGCTCTILVQPPKQGDPIFNHLHIPPMVDQTEHTHPSHRIGIVTRGSGVATSSDGWKLPLTAGAVFYLPEHESHCFNTLDSTDGLDIITYHPDSDWGPTDEVHPMLSRTHING